MMNYNGWDREYLENKELYYELFDKAMAKEPEGPTEELEQAFRDYTGRKHCVPVSSATDALYFSLKAHGIGPGWQVFVTGFSWISSASCISMAGAIPVFCDIDPDSYHMTLESVKKMKRDGNCALIYTHLFGNMTDTTEIENYCKENDIVFIEDAAQSLGVSLNDRKAGTIGDCSSYSFNGNKVIAGISGGGMFMTDDDQIAKTVRMLAKHGKDKDFAMLGYNSKMYNFNADVILHRFQFMEKWQKRRQEIAKEYDYEFDGLVKTPQKHDNHNYHKYVIQFEDKETRNEVKKALGGSVHYERVIPDNSMYNYIQYRSGYCSVARHTADTVLSLPIHAWLKDEEIEHVINTVALRV